MKRTAALAFTVLVCLGCARVAWGNHGGCHFNNFTELQHGTALYIGQNLLNILNAYPQLWTVLGAARDAWLGTNAGNRIGDWNGVQNTPDCPVGLPTRLGAMDFSQGGCDAIGSGGAIAVTDYEVFPYCPSGCGTKSIIINTNVMWSFNPGPNEFDVQSAMAHEFGHMLGFRHQYHDQCREDLYAGCADPDKNTMNFLFPGETCLRDRSMWDTINANVVYPNP
jgi:reprolysin-like metallo-peptidase family M12B